MFFSFHTFTHSLPNSSCFVIHCAVRKYKRNESWKGEYYKKGVSNNVDFISFKQNKMSQNAQRYSSENDIIFVYRTKY